MYNQNQTSEKQIAVLIDFENIGLTDIRSLFDRISENGRITVKIAYADWSKASKSRDQILELGIEPIHIFRSPSKRKNTCDIRLTIDAIELLFSTPVDTFVIVSSDSDFVPLVNKLRSSGKIVYVACDNSKALDTLRISCDKYFEIEPNKGIQEIGAESANIANKKPNTPKTVKKAQTATKPLIDNIIEQQIDQAWAKRATANGKSIPGPNAAGDVVTILKIDKLKNSPYKTLQGVLEASPLLKEHWLRKKNTIFRKFI
jgi:uncharacterized protein (TIGR00288 family)